MAQATALEAAITFLPRQGASTRLPIGSHIRPSEFCKAREAAPMACNSVPPFKPTKAAAAIPPAEPVSAIQPPTSAAKVAFFAIKTPINPAESKAFTISSSGKFMECAMPKTAPGNAPQEPAVGAATMMPIELLTSITAETYIVIKLLASPPNNLWDDNLSWNCKD